MTVNASIPQVSFVVPLFNTGAALPALLEAFRSLTIEGGWELVLVDDGSTDGTPRKAASLLHEIRGQVVLVELSRNFGEHAAVLEGYRQAKGRYVVNLDDDLQNPVSEALKLLAELQASGADVVYSHYEQKQHHWARNWGSRCLDRAATLLLEKPRDLYLSSFRAVRRELLDRIVQYRGPYPYIDGLILGATNRITRLTVVHQPRVEGRSSYTLRKLLRVAANVCFDFSIIPLRLAGLLGIVLCAIGLVMFSMVMVEAVTTGRVQPGWGSLMAVITLFSGSQLLMLGIIGEYVGRAFLTVSGKPQSLVRQITVHPSL